MRCVLTCLALILIGAPLQAQAKTDAVANLRKASKALKRCPTLSTHAHIEDGFEHIEMPMAHGASARRSGGRSGSFWIIGVWGGGMGRWASFSETIHVVDPRRCTALIATVNSTASDPTSGVELKFEGKPSRAQHQELLTHLKARRGHATDKRFAFGRLAREQANDTPTPLAWLPGKPVAQLRAFWPASKSGGVLTASAKAPVLWQSLGRYALWMSDEGPRFRRGRQAVVIYDTVKKRHTWVMATPLHEASNGRLAYLGHVGAKAYVMVDGGMAKEVYTVDPIEGLVGLGGFETVTVKGGLLHGTPMVYPNKTEPAKVWPDLKIQFDP